MHHAVQNQQHIIAENGGPYFEISCLNENYPSTDERRDPSYSSQTSQALHSAV
jgi:hypothetical protein